MSPETTTDSTGDAPLGSQHSNTVGVLPQYSRNMEKMKPSHVASDDDQPARTESNPSPAKKSAGPRVPGQSQTRSHVDSAIKHELHNAHYNSPDLAEHMFGHLVSYELARDILQHLLDKGAVRVFEGKQRDKRVSLFAESEGARDALAQVVRDARDHGLWPIDSQGALVRPDQTSDGKKKTVYSWEWEWFPPEPVKEDPLVSFLNKIIDTAFAFVKSRLGTLNNELRHRFAAPTNKHHAIPLAYEADGEDMRPDFFLLPIEAFNSDRDTVDETYINFTALRAVGESKNKALSEGVSQVHRYLRGIRRSQPWVHFAVAMVATKDRFCLLRGDSSGMERVELTLTTGRGCLEFIRILLGSALADGVDLGQHPDVKLHSEVRPCRIPDPPRAAPKAKESTSVHAGAPSDLEPPQQSTRDPVKRLKTAAGQLPMQTFSATMASQSGQPDPPTTSRQSQQSTSSKRNRSEIEDESNPPDNPLPKKLKFTEVERRVFFPVEIHGHKSLGILFTTCSIRGRSTVVFAVYDPNTQGKLLVLKMSWQDVARLQEQNQVLARLEQRGLHANVIVPLKHFIASRKGKDCTTLGTIRGLLDNQLARFAVENRALVVSTSELQRPVKYFWGVHDFVRGLRGALKGHEYLVSIGILHRDFSENNMVLGRYPGGVRGYIIDLDMAILQEADKPTTIKSEAGSDSDLSDSDTEIQPENPVKQDPTQPVKGLRTGTTPYMSFNVLFGRKHTHFDDVESFLYVLLLFFFSYSGALSKRELLAADAHGFIEAVGSGRLSHMTRWPPVYASWAEEDFTSTAKDKLTALIQPNAHSELVNSPEFQKCLKNWHPDLHKPIKVLLRSAWKLFSRSLVFPPALRTEVSHAQFIRLLDKWFAQYAHLEKRFSSCPFEEPDAQ